MGTLKNRCRIKLRTQKGTLIFDGQPCSCKQGSDLKVFDPLEQVLALLKQVASDKTQGLGFKEYSAALGVGLLSFDLRVP